MDPISPRKLLVSFDEDIPRNWCNGSAFMTHMLNTYTLLVPDNETYYIRHLKRSIGELSDNELKREVQDFCRQEAQHGVGHRAYWRNLDDLGIRYRGLVDAVGWFNYRLLEPLMPRKLHLANIACIEHINAYIGNYFLRRDLLRDSDPRMKILFNWHFAEEIEHGHVAFDVYQHTCGNYFVRALGGILVFPLFYLVNTVGTLYLLGQDGSLWQWRTWRDFGRFLFRQGALAHTLRNILVYFRPGFHPRQVCERELAESILRNYEELAYLGEISSASRQPAEGAKKDADIGNASPTSGR